jgi:hypothetical protein
MKEYNIEFAALLSKIKAKDMEDAIKIARKFVCDNPEKCLNTIYCAED